MKKWVKGNPAIQAKYDGKRYYFPSNEQKETFLADPAKYVPALGGDCTVCAVNMGESIPGSIRHAALSHKRLYLFPSHEQQQEFLANPAKYVDVDLAYGGKCVVCSIEMNKGVAGKPEIAAYHQGLRYLFPSAEQRDMFLANPAKYAVQTTDNAASTRN
jgi:YHS domain-containing protein